MSRQQFSHISTKTWLSLSLPKTHTHTNVNSTSCSATLAPLSFYAHFLLLISILSLIFHITHSLLKLLTMAFGAWYFKKLKLSPKTKQTYKWKQQWDTTTYKLEWLKSRILAIPKAGKDVKKQEISFTAGENTK